MQSPFRPTGPTVLLVATGSLPQAVQVPSTEQVGNQNYILTNSGANIAFISCEATKSNAEQVCALPTTVSSARVYPLLNGSQVTITGPVNAWFAGQVTVTACSVFITPGYGQ